MPLARGVSPLAPAATRSLPRPTRIPSGRTYLAVIVSRDDAGAVVVARSALTVPVPGGFEAAQRASASAPAAIGPLVRKIFLPATGVTTSGEVLVFMKQ